MKLHVVYNEGGEILGAARINVGAGIQARPRADEQAGQRAAEVTVPPEYERLDLAAVLRDLRVDMKGKSPELKSRD